MRVRWEPLHASLVQAVATPSARAHLEHLRSLVLILRCFGTADAIVDFLHVTRGSLDEKDALLAALVARVQRAELEAELAQHLLWLGLWPGLDALYRRRLRHFRLEPERLVSEIAYAFLASVVRADLSRVHRVAATLVRNTERDLVTGLRRSWNRSAIETGLPDRPDTLPALRSRGPSPLGGGPHGFGDAEVMALREQLVALVGSDADLVVGAVLYGESQREVADSLGLTHEAGRKRFQRVLVRLRALLAPRGVYLSPQPVADRVSRSGRSSRPARRPREATSTTGRGHEPAVPGGSARAWRRVRRSRD